MPRNSIALLLFLTLAAACSEVAAPSTEQSANRVEIDSSVQANGHLSNSRPSESPATAVKSVALPDTELAGHAGPPAISKEVPVAGRNLRSIFADSVAKWNAALDKAAALSRRGESSVRLRRKVLRALAAPTDAAMYAQLSELPVDVSDSGGYQGSTPGIYRTYSVGTSRFSRFIANQSSSILRERDEEGCVPSLVEI